MYRYNLFISYFLLLLIASCNDNVKQSAQNEFLITGRIKGLHAGNVKLVGLNPDDRTSKTIDSAAFSNDSFTLKGRLDYPQFLSFIVEPGNRALHLFVENSHIKIEGDTTGSEYYDWTAYGGTKGANMKNYIISGSKTNEDYLAYQNDTGQKKFEPVFAALNKKFETVAGKDLDAEYEVRNEMDSVQKLLQKRQWGYIDDYVSKNSSSTVGAYLLSQVYLFLQDKPLAKTDSLLSKFEGDAKNSDYYKSVKTSLDKLKALLPGNTAPDFTLLKRDSSTFSLSSMHGTYTMIDFWPSWCHPCREAIPHWKQTYQKYHTKGFDIVSVSDDSRWTDWFKALDLEKMPWLQVCDEFPVKNMPARVGSLYMTTYIPFYVLLDKDGKILVYSGNEEDIDNKLKEIFDKS